MRTRLRSLCAFALMMAPVLTPSEGAAGDRLLPMAEYIQEVWDARDGGLPHPTVTALRQTRDGYLWIGTYSGLVRFDGLVFHRPATGGHGVYRDHVRGLAESEDGGLWVATRRTGLVRIKDGDVRAFMMPDGLITNDVVAVAAQGARIWGAAGTLISVEADGKVRRYGAEDGLDVAGIAALFAETNGPLWIGGRRGTLVRFDGGRFQTMASGGELETAQVTVIRRDAAGVLRVGTTAGLFELEGEDGERPVLRRSGTRRDSVTSLLADGRGLWLGTAAAGIARLEGERERRYGPEEGLLHEWVLALHEGPQGSLWAGTRIGLVQLRPRVIHVHTKRDGLPREHANCLLAARNGDLWVGTGAGLARLRQGRWTLLETKDGLPNTSVRALVEDLQGTLWIGTGGGVTSYRGGRFVAPKVPAGDYYTRAMALDGAGRVWVGSNAGLDRIEDGVVTRVVSREQLCAKSAVNWVHPAADGSVWIGGEAALMHVRDGGVTCFVEDVARLRNDVRAILEEPDGSLWIGGIGGLARARDGKVERLPGPHAPFNTPNYGIVDDGRGSLWTSTTKGLFQVRKDDLARRRGLAVVRGFGVSDGLVTGVMTGSGQPSSSRGPDGRLYFTSADGVAVVDPARVPPAPTTAAPVYIESMAADGRPVDVRDTPQLAAGTREIELHFAAVNFMAPDLVRYRYRLEGLDADWRDGASRRTAHYTNLQPGRYRFHVMATDHTGAWYEPGASVTFDLLPRFHQTPAFRGLVIAALVGVAFAVHRFRLASARARAAELQRRVSEAMASLQVLRGLLPICGRCRRVRQDSGYWQQLEAYVMERSDARFSHSICKDCYAKLRAEDPNLPDLNAT